MTEIHILKVSRELNELYDIRMLGYYLEVSQTKIDAIIQNKKEDIQEAVYQMLRSWQKSQRTPVEAYSSLWKALTHGDVNLSRIAHKVLVHPSFEKDNSTNNSTTVRFSLFFSTMIEHIFN